MKEQAEQHDTCTVHAEKGQMKEEGGTYRIEEYCRVKKVHENTDVVTYTCINTKTTQRAEWVEIPVQKSLWEECSRKIEETKKTKYAKHLPRILKTEYMEDRIVIVTESTGAMRVEGILEELKDMPDAVVREMAKRILNTLAWMDEMQACSGVWIENLRWTDSGSVYIHENTIWKDVIKMETKEENKQSKQERMRMAGMILLAVSTGIVPCSMTRRNTSSMKEEEKDEVQKRIAGMIMKIESKCMREVVVMLLSSQHTARIVDEIRALHYFYPDEKDVEHCACYRIENEEEDKSYEEMITGSINRQMESVYDHTGGVAVKATTMGGDKYTFQMHFFKTSKSVSFEFNKQEDTVESVVKEMEDEGLAEEEQASAIKAHIESLIVKIENNTTSSAGSKQNNNITANNTTPSSVNTVATSSTSTGTGSSSSDAIANSSSDTASIAASGAVLNTMPASMLCSPSDTPERAGSSDTGAQSANTSPLMHTEDSTECTKTAYKDSQSIEEFIQDVAQYVKRSKCAGESWIEIVKKQDINTVGDLKVLTEEDWESIKLPVFASRAIKNMLYGPCSILHKESMLRIDETMKEYTGNSTVEELIIDTTQKYNRPEMINDWLSRITCQDIRTVQELKLLREEDWEQLDLSVFSHRVIKNAVFRKSKHIPHRSIEDK